MSLISLPTDVRTRIWRLLLTRPCPVDIIFEKKRADNDLKDACFATGWTWGCSFMEAKYYGARYDYDPRSYRIRPCHGPMFSTAVLYICKSIYEEAVKVLYGENMFVLAAVTLDEVPTHFDFFRVRHLHLDARALTLDPSSMIEYNNVLRGLNLSSETRLTVTTNSKQTNSSDMLPALEVLGPVKSCTLSLAFCPEAKSLAKRLMNDKQEAPSFSRYIELPPELHCHILSFTELVGTYYIVGGRLSTGTSCCELCTETFSGCCCIQFPRAYSHPPSAVIGSRFSEACRCKYGPLPLLYASSRIQENAFQVFFSRSEFIIAGSPSDAHKFLDKIGRHVRLLKRISLEIEPLDLKYHTWHQGDWDRLIQLMRYRLLLPSLSLKIFLCGGSYLPTNNSDYDEFRGYCALLIPGLQRLISNGLKNFSVHCSYDDSGHFADAFRRRIVNHDNESTDGTTV